MVFDIRVGIRLGARREVVTHQLVVAVDPTLRQVHRLHELQLEVDADRLELLLHRFEHDRAVLRAAEEDRGELQPIGVAGGSQELFGFRRVLLEVRELGHR